MKKIKKFVHDFLGWGFPVKALPKNDGHDGFQMNYSCQFCSDEITQDSQLNWFHLTP